ncbi:cell division protein FtsA [Caminicella sporogenes DSM 14501]|uniref:Cell division protein FtsA n=1 Tax=Caminicella sporogenes DSM 14501 TaxID=1121266 RepID=A0A1M6MUS2_9FIRM|nr:cell division FtsA domain-containing protein [Caminicella sporogenes]RKD22493.1 actin-like ATPase involved in cell division [Caminicella sporogenes]SHJ87150.1 cell division protein FtsA [Caminicella sporogenes DSM 14501]
MGDVVFSLDIGTRNVVGIVAKMEDDKYKVIDYEIMEHPERAMYDGQIHDIEKVSLVVDKVKTRLEERLSLKLQYVSIAAAGRALKTQKVFVQKEIDFTKEIDKAVIDSLEIEGIQLAQKKLEEVSNDEDTRYYCVGYTVMNYYLDGSVIGNLKGHRGREIGAEILATFLPHVVVDSLYTVVHKCGLEVVNMTLEPIAAINIAIPPKFRLLNLALVDIGAGTSDIAITKDGTIVSYAMVSTAGDEITECLSKTFLLDFDTAEKLKIQLNQKDEHTFCDIVGISYNLKTDEIVEKIEEAIRDLSKEISDKILEYNGKAPSAVFCIGGGSQIPKLTEYLAQDLGLPKERVVIKGTEVFENVEFLKDSLCGPEYITPIGIGYTAVKDKEQDFLQVTVNGKSIRLFNSKELCISDALILIGYNARKLIPERGKSVTFYINGVKRTIYGEYGEAAKIYINDKLGNLDTKLKNMDRIVINPATPGKDAKVKIKDIIEGEEVILNGQNINLIKDIFVNGKEVDEDYEILDGDEVVIEKIDNISELMNICNIDLDKSEVFINDKLANKDEKLKKGMVINTKLKAVESEEKGEASKTILRDDKDYITVTVNGEKVDIKKEKKDIIFVDIFNYIDFDIKVPKGILVLKLNGKKASYTDVLKDGDVVEIYWN